MFSDAQAEAVTEQISTAIGERVATIVLSGQGAMVLLAAPLGPS